jgi:myo-inositol-1(or 4)-monophosphatase
MDFTYSDALTVGMQAARSAGNFLLKSLGSVSAQEIVFKGDIDIVTAYDLEAQRLVMEILSHAFPEHSFLSEEERYGNVAPTSGSRWIIDPLDGTSNFTRGFPHFCVSLALEVAGRVQAGIVYAPVLEEMFTAVRGCGAALNGHPIHVSSTSRLIDSLVATGFPYYKHKNLQDCLGRLARIADAIRSPRVVGAAALDICYVACGRLDAYWDTEMSPWDMSAGTLIVEEAGGRVTNVAGEPFDHLGQTVIASNGILHPEVLNTLGMPAS